MCTQHLKNLNVIIYNVQSIVSHSKTIALNNFLDLHKPEFVFISETRLKKKHIISLKNYNIFRNDQINKNVGTAIIIKDSIKAERISIPNLKQLEITAITVQMSNLETLLLISVYNKCSANSTDLKHDLNSLLPILNKHTYYIIGGDFNARHSLWNDSQNSSAGSTIADWLQTNASVHNLCAVSQPYPTFPRGGSTLDFFLASSNLVNILPHISNYHCSILTSDSDHYAVQLKIIMNYQLNINTIGTESRINYRKINWTTFKLAVCNNLNINSLRTTHNLSNDEIDKAVDLFHKSIKIALDQQAIPFKAHYKYKDLPTSIIKLYTYRTQLRKNLRKVLHQTLNRVNAQYKSILSQINCLSTIINQQTKNFLNNQFHLRLSKIKPGPDTFKSINKIIGRKAPIPETISDGSMILSSSSEKSKAFAEHFEKNFTPKPPTHLPDFYSNVNDTVQNLKNNQHSIDNFSSSNDSVNPLNQDIFTNTGFIEFTIQTGNSKKSTGPDGISSFVLKQLPFSAILFLTVIFNNCINNSYFPNNWKTSTIFPIPKKGSSSNISDFRPISLLNSVSKIFEKIILHKMTTFCEDHNINQENQFGFKKSHSTLLALLKFHSDITKNLNKKETTAACFLDIEKAFDSVWIDGLVFKLISFGFPSPITRLILNYLSNRKFRVLINNNFSPLKTVKAGVPQGSVLGPKLFNLYISDQPRNNPPTSTIMYADDSLTYASSISAKSAVLKIKQHLENLWKYYQKWGMKINVTKSELLFLRNSSSHSNSSRYASATTCKNLSLSLNNEVITSKRSVKYLGIHFSELFKFNSHVNSIIKKANFAFHLVHPLMRIQQGLPTQTKLLLYKQLIRPIITYGFPVWFTISKSYMEKILILERKILRVCTNLYRNPSNSHYYSNKTLYEKANIDPIDQYLLKLAKQSLAKLNNHPNDLIKNITALELHTSMRYLHCTSIATPSFQPVFYSGERLIFYSNSTTQFHRG